jgi:NADH-quinone oxidoreductase subunit H
MNGVGVLWVVSHTALLALALTAGGLGPARGWSLRRAWRACARTVTLCGTAGAALALVVVEHGSLRLEDLVRAQGPWPWNWTAAQSPPALGLALLWLATGPGWRWDARDVASGPGATERAGEKANRERWRTLVGWVYGLTMCAVATSTYLGGWQLAGLEYGALEPSWGWQFLGTALFVGKAWGLFFAIAALHRATATVVSDDVLAKVAWWQVPLSLLFLTAAIGWSAWPLGATATRALAIGAAILGGTFTIHVLVHVQAWRREPLTHVDPFI